jgi:hypothetical protein
MTFSYIYTSSLLLDDPSALTQSRQGLELMALYPFSGIQKRVYVLFIYFGSN